VNERKLIRILSIDGGGIRGIIPALMLAKIEEQAKLPACRLFDLIAGTSTGGIIALGVTVPEVTAPGESMQPRWRAQDLVNLYSEAGPEIFASSLMRKLDTGWGVLRERYPARALEAALERYMGEAQLSQALTDVLITSYDIQSHEPFFFKRSQARAESARDYPMRVVARATSAAPTYFQPEHVVPSQVLSGQPEDYALVDGGTFANNPAMCAYAEAVRDNPGAEVLIVSLGTGRLTEPIAYAQARHWGLLGWARPVFNVMMDGSSAAVDYQLDQLLGADDHPEGRHFRFQTRLSSADDSLDNASEQNIADLKRLGEELVKRSAPRIERVCELLTRLAPIPG
jgi:uncharacterized protein